MVNVNPEGATPEEELIEGEPGSEELENLGGAASDDEDAGEGTNLNPKAFKGLQRRLSAKDRELERLRSEAEKLRSQAQSGALPVDDVIRLVRPVIDAIKMDNPDMARQLATSIASSIDQRNNQSAQEQLQQYQERERREAEEAEVIDDLRELAADLGADPDDEELDYGDSSMSLRQRMAVIRQTAKALSKPAKPTPPKPTQNTGAAVNDRTGTPPSPRGKVKYTREDLNRALAAYTETHKREHLTKANEIRQALIADAEAALSR